MLVKPLTNLNKTTDINISYDPYNIVLVLVYNFTLGMPSYLLACNTRASDSPVSFILMNSVLGI